MTKRALTAHFVGTVLLVSGLIGQAVTCGLGASLCLFTPRGRVWGEVVLMGCCVTGVASLLQAPNAKRPRWS